MIQSPARSGSPLMIVTDLDGTLLDDRDYSFEAARPALSRIVELGVTLTLASSKTRFEMEAISRELGIRGPMIAENGGLLLTPVGDTAYEVELDGTDRGDLARSLAEISRETGARLLGFSELDWTGVSAFTGLSPVAARLALERERDEPFVLHRPVLADRIARAAERRGLRISRGGRFFHLTGPHDKGTALRRLLDHFSSEGAMPRTIGLGDAANDLPFLRLVDRPILIPAWNSVVRHEVAEAMPGAERAPLPGPAGWNAAVLAVLAGGHLPRLGAREAR